jgi:hypothetical protein
MNNRKIIQKELNEWSSKIPSNLHEPVFSLPNTYFENFAFTVLAKIKIENDVHTDGELIKSSPVFSLISREMPFQVPEDYFTNFADITIASDSDKLPKIIAEIEKVPPFKIPTGYFNAFPATVLTVLSVTPARTIPLYQRNWVRMSVAAIVAGIISISSFLYLDNQKNSIPESSSASLEQNLKDVADNDIEEFIRTADATGEIEEAQLHTSFTDVTYLLKDIQDHEIDAFLDQVPEGEEL